MRRSVRARTALTVGILISGLLSGCLLQFTEPEIVLTIKDGYNEQEVLIPYILYGSEADAYAAWSLSVFNPGAGEWEFLDSRRIRLPSGTSGVLQLGELPDAQYELVFELLTTRDGSYDPVPYLTRRRVFYVDRVPPNAGGIVLNYIEDGTPIGDPWSAPPPAPPLPSLTSRVELELTAPGHDPASESPVRVLYHIDDFSPPVPGEDEYEGRFFLWDNASSYPAVIMVAIDAAGNRSQVRVEP